MHREKLTTEQFQWGLLATPPVIVSTIIIYCSSMASTRCRTSLLTALPGKEGETRERGGWQQFKVDSPPSWKSTSTYPLKCLPIIDRLWKRVSFCNRFNGDVSGGGGRFGADILSLAQFFGQREKHRGEYYLIIERKFYFILFSRNYIFLYIIHKTNVNVILYIYLWLKIYVGWSINSKIVIYIPVVNVSLKLAS